MSLKTNGQHFFDSRTELESKAQWLRSCDSSRAKDLWTPFPRFSTVFLSKFSLKFYFWPPPRAPNHLIHWKWCFLKVETSLRVSFDIKLNLNSQKSFDVFWIGSSVSSVSPPGVVKKLLFIQLQDLRVSPLQRKGSPNTPLPLTEKKKKANRNKSTKCWSMGVLELHLQTIIISTIIIHHTWYTKINSYTYTCENRTPGIKSHAFFWPNLATGQHRVFSKSYQVTSLVKKCKNM